MIDHKVYGVVEEYEPKNGTVVPVKHDMRGVGRCHPGETSLLQQLPEAASNGSTVSRGGSKL